MFGWKKKGALSGVTIEGTDQTEKIWRLFKGLPCSFTQPLMHDAVHEHSGLTFHSDCLQTLCASMLTRASTIWKSWDNDFSSICAPLKALHCWYKHMVKSLLTGEGVNCLHIHVV